MIQRPHHAGIQTPKRLLLGGCKLARNVRIGVGSRRTAMRLIPVVQVALPISGKLPSLKGAADGLMGVDFSLSAYGHTA